MLRPNIGIQLFIDGKSRLMERNPPVVQVKAIHIQDWADTYDSRSLRLPEFPENR